jgi:putative ABC transport system ATP-binding protein
MRDIRKIYGMGDTEVHALRGVDLDVYEGEFVSIMGPSGSGKSTLMHILGCLDTPTSGSYLLGGEDVSAMDESELAHVRNRLIGFVFQQYNLLPKLTAQANVALPLIFAGVRRAERMERAAEALRRVGLGERLGNRPNQLSGGQQQRVALARALVTEPTIILADEPTGALDSTSSHEVLSWFAELNESGKTVVLITHEADVAAVARRQVRVRDGLIVEEGALDTAEMEHAH